MWSLFECSTLIPLYSVSNYMYCWKKEKHKQILKENQISLKDNVFKTINLKTQNIISKPKLYVNQIVKEKPICFSKKGKLQLVIKRKVKHVQRQYPQSDAFENQIKK